MKVNIGKIILRPLETANKCIAGALGAKRRRMRRHGISGPPIKKPPEAQTAGHRGADKFRITTIMTQAVHGWFQRSDDAPVCGTIWPTVCIFVGSVCCLEEMKGRKGTYSGVPSKGKNISLRWLLNGASFEPLSN